MRNRLLVWMFLSCLFPISLHSALSYVIDFSENLIINRITDKLLPEKNYEIKTGSRKEKIYNIGHRSITSLITIVLQQSCKLGFLYYTSPELLISKTLFRCCTTLCGIPFEFFSKNRGDDLSKQKLNKDLTCFFQDNLIIARSFREYQYENVIGYMLSIDFMNACFKFLEDKPNTYGIKEDTISDFSNKSGKHKSIQRFYEKIESTLESVKFIGPHLLALLRKADKASCIVEKIAILFTQHEKYGDKKGKIYFMSYQLLRQLLLPFKGWILWYFWQKYVYTQHVAEKVRKNQFFSYIYLLFQKEQTYLKKKFNSEHI